MNCPFCGKETEKGFVGAAGIGMPTFIYWLDEAYYMQHTAVPATAEKFLAAGGCVIKNQGGLAQTPNTFYYCRACGKLIGDVS